jgi:tetratricopeptide (TPR) repeat protein
VSHLLKAVEIGPKEANTWNALGLAYERKGEVEEALKALEHSLSLDPENGYSLRNLGGLLAKTDPTKGLPYLRKAALLLPGDQVTQYNFGLCLIKAGQSKEADQVLAAAVEVAPHSRLAQRCEELRNSISNEALRAGAGDGLRMDAVTYCLSALKTLRELGPEQFRAITVEIALLGQNGLDINNSTPKYTLKSLPGKFSGMQLVSYMYAGFRHFAPDDDAGIDLSREYEAAKLLFDGKQPG